MSQQHPLVNLLREDSRYRLEAYQFVRDALSYAQEQIALEAETPDRSKSKRDEEDEEEAPPDSHLTGQQLCEAMRRYALEQYGLMAQTVLNSWGIQSTSDVGNIVYNLINIGLMKKSATDRREDFDGVYDFDTALRLEFQITRGVE
jgi:uncharacterized repeat protein (TIGR04138 family)